MSWNNVLPSWCLVPCKECNDYHPDHMTCEERAELRAEQEKAATEQGESDE
jgi:hypothetical protein